MAALDAQHGGGMIKFIVCSIAVICYGFGCFELGKRSVKPIILTPAPIMVDMNKQCVAWLFDTNLKEAKKRICKK